MADAGTAPVKHVDAADETATAREAGALAAQLKPGDLVFLRGDLGAGKTTFVRGVVAGCDGDPIDVASPTYALVHVYETPRGPLVHADLYRLGAADEVAGLELDRWLQRAPVLVEWPERGAAVLPVPTWEIALAPGADEHGRTITIRGPLRV